MDNDELMPKGKKHEVSSERGESQKEKAITFTVAVRNWDQSQNRVSKTIFEFTAKEKYVKIHSSEKGVTKVEVEVGDFKAMRYAGIVVDGKEIRVPPQGLIIKL